MNISPRRREDILLMFCACFSGGALSILCLLAIAGSTRL